MEKRNRSKLLILIFILLGIYFFILGDSGILERMKLIQGNKELKKSISGLVQERDKLQKQYSIISNNQTNRNFYKEEASKSGYIAPGEKYIFFKSSGEKEKISTEVSKKKDKYDKYSVELSHLRILWAVASIMIILLYFGKRRKEKEKETLQDL